MKALSVSFENFKTIVLWTSARRGALVTGQYAASPAAGISADVVNKNDLRAAIKFWRERPRILSRVEGAIILAHGHLNMKILNSINQSYHQFYCG